MKHRSHLLATPASVASPSPAAPKAAVSGNSADSPLLLATEAATYTKISVRTLARGRAEGWGPVFVQLTNNRLAYRKADLDGWLAARIVAGGENVA